LSHYAPVCAGVCVVGVLDVFIAAFHAVVGRVVLGVVVVLASRVAKHYCGGKYETFHIIA
jgi:hypothetical protein